MQSQSNNATAETSIRHRLFGFFLFPIALFPLLALCSYNWHDVPTLCVPPADPASNLIGAVGTWFAYYGYQIIGLAIWFIPVLCIVLGSLLVIGCSMRLTRRVPGLLLFMLSTTCLLQLCGHVPALTRILHSLNISPNAGGAIGYLVMTRCLARLLSPFGAGVLMASIMAFSIVFTIGFRNIISLIARITAWASDVGNNSDDDEALDDDEKIDSVNAARAAREEAKAQRIAEKQRIAEEKAAIKAAKEAAKLAAREELQQRREAERLRKEEEQKARELEREQLRERLQADLAAARNGDNYDNQTDWLRPREAPVPAAAATSPSPVAPAPAEPVIRPVRSVTQPPLPVREPETINREPENNTPEPQENKGPYILPPVTLLHDVPPKVGNGDDPSVMAQRLIDTLKVFDVNAQLAYYIAGPVVTQYALTLDLGTRVEKVAGLQKNIQMALQATSLRIEAPIPGKNAVGIEVPNTKPASVCFREIYDGELWQKNSPGKFQVPLLLGKDAAGNDLIADLAKLPHLLVAGATGQGKSVCLNSIINGLLMCRTPEQLKLIMVDPKRVEFTQYNQLPHLLVPIINDTKKVVFALRAAVVEMDRRLKLFSKVHCRNIVDFNNRKTVTQTDMFSGAEEVVGDPDTPRTVPYIVIIIDEVADIMQAAKKEVEPVIMRLTALARATGIHLILATQRPDTNIITGVIKSNIPGRISFKTSSYIDSRTILDATGSELLIGKGDMLFKMADGRLLRAQGAYISDEEIDNITSFIGEHSNVQFDEKLTKRLERIKEADMNEGLDDEESADESAPAAVAPGDQLAAPTASGMPAPAGMTQGKEDTLYRRALEVLRDTKRASISHFQRRMGIGYNHAARIVDLLEERGVIGTAKGAGPREILLDPESILAQMDGTAAPIPPPEAAVEPNTESVEQSPYEPIPQSPEDDPFGFPTEN